MNQEIERVTVCVDNGGLLVTDVNNGVSFEIAGSSRPNLPSYPWATLAMNDDDKYWIEDIEALIVAVKKLDEVLTERYGDRRNRT